MKKPGIELHFSAPKNIGLKDLLHDELALQRFQAPKEPLIERLKKCLQTKSKKRK